MERIQNCRICHSPLTEDVLQLGPLALTGMFIENGSDVPTFEISLSICSSIQCGLVQLNEIFDLRLLYGDSYGYASKLNASMVEHLENKAELLKSKIPLSDGDVVIDIGSNDATTLSFFPNSTRRIGVDCIGEKFASEYRTIGAELISEFFPSEKLVDSLGSSKAKIVSSYSCFYDLPDPIGFAKGVASVLADDGIWCLEQSYLSAMLRTNSFDTVCHEHMEYYRLIDIQNICDAAGLKILNVAFNDINGGSFSLEVAHEGSPWSVDARIAEILEEERNTDWLEEFRAFRDRISQCGQELIKLLEEIKASGNRAVGLGASTKGNVLLQFNGITPDLLDSIGDVNAEKFGCETPGSGIPIVSEDQLLAANPDYLLVLPWHFREFFINLPKLKGQKLIFPLPKVEIVELG